MNKKAKDHQQNLSVIINKIVKRTINNGGNMADVMSLLSQVIAGTFVRCVNPGKDDEILDIVMADVRKNIRNCRIMEKPPEGSA